MSDVPVQLVVAAFNDEKAADQAMKDLKMAKYAGLIGIKEGAVIYRDQKDKLHIKEIGDMGGGKGSVLGAVVGGAIGLLAGPVVLLGATGAVIGGLAAKFRDSGIPDHRLEKLGASLKPGTSCIVAVIEHKWVAEMEKQLAEAGADVMTEAIASDIAQQLEEGKDVTITAIETDEAVAVQRTAGNEQEVEIGGIVLTEDGIMFRDAVANQEGVAIHEGVVTEEGVAERVTVATEDGAAVVEAIETDEGAVVAAAVATPELEGGDEEESDVIEGEATAAEDSSEEKSV